MLLVLKLSQELGMGSLHLFHLAPVLLSKHANLLLVAFGCLSNRTLKSLDFLL